MNKYWAHLPLVLLIALLTLASSMKMNGRSYRFDALENAVASYHLMKTGTISMDGITPTNFREPLPVILLAAYMGCCTSLADMPLSGKMQGAFIPGERISQIDTIQFPVEFLATPEQRRQVSFFHLPFIFASLWLIFLLTKQLGQRPWVATVVMLLSWLYFFNSAYLLYRPMTEYESECLLLLVALLQLKLLKQPTPSKAAWLGVCLGLLALTKAAALYASMVAMPLTVGLIARQHSFNRRQWVVMLLAMLVGLILVVSPWLLRNVIATGQGAISERSGLVLLTRAYKNQMNADEYIGAYFVYAPYELKTSPTFRHWFGYDQPGTNLAIQLQRLYRSRPGDAAAAERGDEHGAISFFHKALAYQRQQIMQAPVGADSRVRAHAVALIRSDVIAHLKTIPLFAWRGLWCFGHPDPVESHVGGWPGVILNVLAFLSLLSLPLLARIRKRNDYLLVSFMPISLFLFYACLSHFVPRYAAPLIPFAFLSLWLWIQTLVRYKSA